MASNTNNDKEVLINEKIEQIRKKNEEIRLRHLEVLEDKKNADAFSASEAIRPQPVTHIKPMVKPPSKKAALSTQRSNRNTERLPQSLEQEKTTTQPSSSGKIYSNFAEGDGPPPDPGYSFLADDERDAPRIEIKDKRVEKHSNKANETGKAVNLSYKLRQQGNAFSSTPKMKKENRMHNVADQNWRAERAAIDEARIQRQKTVEGNWRRAWDCEKADDEERNSAVTEEHKLPYKYTEYSGRNVPLRKPSFTRTVVFSSNNDFPSECSASDKGERSSAADHIPLAMPPRHVVFSGENVQMTVNGAYDLPPSESLESASDIYTAFENFQVQRVANNELNSEGAANLIRNRSKLRPLSKTTKVVQSGHQADKIYGIIKGGMLNKTGSKVYNDEDSWDDCSEEDP